MTHNNRRDFLTKAPVMAAAGSLTLAGVHIHKEYPKTSMEMVNLIGPKEGYTPHVGTLVSMMVWMRGVMLSPVRGMGVSDLDYLLDDNSNSIGAMLLHLAAIDRWYQEDTFDGKTYEDKRVTDLMWSAGSDLGNAGRKHLKGFDLDFYLDVLEKSRAFTFAEFAKRDDDWLFKKDHGFGWSGGPINNYCKWFHVCEHESNHNGQFKFIKSRIK